MPPRIDALLRVQLLDEQVIIGEAFQKADLEPVEADFSAWRGPIMRFIDNTGLAHGRELVGCDRDIGLRINLKEKSSGHSEPDKLAGEHPRDAVAASLE